MLYRGPKTAGGWLKNRKTCRPQNPCQLKRTGTTSPYRVAGVFSYDN